MPKSQKKWFFVILDLFCEKYFGNPNENFAKNKKKTVKKFCMESSKKIFSKKWQKYQDFCPFLDDFDLRLIIVRERERFPSFRFPDLEKFWFFLDLVKFWLFPDLVKFWFFPDLVKFSFFPDLVKFWFFMLNISSWETEPAPHPLLLSLLSSRLIHC